MNSDASIQHDRARLGSWGPDVRGVRCACSERSGRPGPSGTPEVWTFAKRPASCRRSGMSLLQTAVAIAIITVLMVTLMPTLNHALALSRQTVSLTHVRQLLIGHQIYQADYSGALLFGYTPPSIEGKPVTVETPSGHTFGLPVADRYPWRLAPYVANCWELLHSHADQPEAPLPNEDPNRAMMKAYQLSLNPAYGINSVYVGGHHGMFEGFRRQGSSWMQNTLGPAVFVAGQVVNPASQILFAESQAVNAPGLAEGAGMHFLMPPRARGLNWIGENGQFRLVNTGRIMGLPKGRHTDRAATGFMDLHVEAMLPEQLNDMRLWSAKAIQTDEDFIPTLDNE